MKLYLKGFMVVTRPRQQICERSEEWSVFLIISEKIRTEEIIRLCSSDAQVGPVTFSSHSNMCMQRNLAKYIYNDKKMLQ